MPTFVAEIIIRATTMASKLSKSTAGILTCILAGLVVFASSSVGSAQSYSIDWYTIDGGGGTSTGGVYSVSATIGQPDAGTMSGGNFTLVGGFWSIVSAVQTVNAPFLTVFFTSTNTVVVSWPLPDAGWVLQWDPSVANPGGWNTIPGTYQTDGTRRYYTEAVPVGNKFYRLYHP